MKNLFKKFIQKSKKNKRKNDKKTVNIKDLYPIIDEKLYTSDETALLLSITKNTLYAWSCQNRISKTKNGGKLCFTGKQIKDYLFKMEVAI